MQHKNLKLQRKRLSALPIIQETIDHVGLGGLLEEFVGNNRYASALLVMLKNVLLERGALYRVQEWAKEFEPSLIDEQALNDDLIGRALDKLYEADRASMQTKCVLSTIKKCGLTTDVIHNDTTSVSVSGRYESQDKCAIQLKRGHSKDHRPDLKQLVYALSVTEDGGLPVHFKTYDGNQTDDTTHQETWLTLRGLLGRSDFLYVADSKLCSEENLKFIDRNQGRFITVVPKTRLETKEFSKEAYHSQVRWEALWRRRVSRKKDKYDQFEVAQGFYQLREGYAMYWYRSSEKMKRDIAERDNKIAAATDKLTNLMSTKRRGPKTAKALMAAAARILAKTKTSDWINIIIEQKDEVTYRKSSRGKPGKDASYRRIDRKIPKLVYTLNHESIAKSKSMDGIFPLTTNANLNALEALKHYKYQPKLEKRFTFLKSVTQVAPIFLKNNRRIEALMFIYFLALLVAAVIERKLKLAMVNNGIESLPTLPEGRLSKSPTWEQIVRLFEHHHRHALYDGIRSIKTFSDPLAPIQCQVLALLNISTAAYG
jgi:transposase